MQGKAAEVESQSPPAHLFDTRCHRHTGKCDRTSSVRSSFPLFSRTVSPADEIAHQTQLDKSFTAMSFSLYRTSAGAFIYTYSTDTAVRLAVSVDAGVSSPAAEADRTPSKAAPLTKFCGR
jgi:hypothetical protein